MLSNQDKFYIFDQLWQTSSDTFWICKPINGDFELLAINPADTKYVPDYQQGMKLSQLFADHQESLEGYWHCLSTGENTRFEQHPVIEGKQFAFDTLLIPIKSETGNINFIVGTSRDITERHETGQRLCKLNQLLDEKVTHANKTIEELIGNLEALVQERVAAYLQSQDAYQTIEQQLAIESHIAATDMLTGLMNRRKLTDYLNDLYAQNNKTYIRNHALLMLDIDHFKQINDNHGHLIGDQVLKWLANVVNGAIRQSDIFARWGGEEFVIVATIENTHAILHFAEAVRQRIEQAQPNEFHVTVSIGATGFEENDTIDSLFDRADKALYAAKNQGRNQCCFVDSSLKKPICASNTHGSTVL